MKDREFVIPKWELLNKFDPFIRLELIVEDEHIKLKESEDTVKNEFVDAFRSIIVSFDKLLNPRCAKVTYN